MMGYKKSLLESDNVVCLTNKIIDLTNVVNIERNVYSFYDVNRASNITLFYGSDIESKVQAVILYYDIPLELSEDWKKLCNKFKKDEGE